MKKTLVDLSKADLLTSKTVIKVKNDEAVINIAAYHCQQAIEKLIKFMLNMEGIRVPFTHDIDELLNMSEEVEKLIPTSITSHKYIITEWATKTRYSTNYRTSVDLLELLIEECEELLEIVEVKYHLK